MTGPVCVAAVDVGNSNVKLAVQVGDTCEDSTNRIDASGWQQSALNWVLNKADCESIEWRIASVRPAASIELADAIRHSNEDAAIHFISRHDVPMPIEVDHPDRVGIDRLLSAYAAYGRARSAAIVIDAGSAVTIDWVCAEGVFRGGAILPGIDLQTRSLATGTAALPDIEWTDHNAIRLPAKNTHDAIRSGVLAGMSGSIDALIQRYLDAAQLPSQDVQVVLTGGDGPILSPHLRHNHQQIPYLVCRGLLDLPRSIGGEVGDDQVADSPTGQSPTDPATWQPCNGNRPTD